jgi:hypothetical protein
MADIVFKELLLDSVDHKSRWKIFVRADGRLVVVQLFEDNGIWKPKGSEKVIAWTDYRTGIVN